MVRRRLAAGYELAAALTVIDFYMSLACFHMEAQFLQTMTDFLGEVLISSEETFEFFFEGDAFPDHVNRSFPKIVILLMISFYREERCRTMDLGCF